MEQPASDEAARCARLFWLWFVARTAIWIGIAVATLPNAPLDLIEWLAWGHQFAWGLPKHPPLPSWVAASFARVSPGDVWGVYIAGYLLAGICVWAAWRVGREYLPPRYALLSALCLEGLIYLTGDSAEFSNNLALNAFWALAVLFFVRAVRTNALRWWLALGGAVGLGLLSKYTLGVLLVALVGYLVFDRDGRRHLRRPGPYLAALVAMVLFAPHAVWLVRNDFITLYYAVDRSAATGWVGHVTHPAGFLAGQLLKLLPVVVILAPLLGGRVGSEQGNPDRKLLHWVVAGPVALLLALSLATGCQLRDIWGSPLWTFTGVWLLTVIGTIPSAQLKWSGRAWVAVATGMIVVCTVKNVAMPYVNRKPSPATYPGRALAAEVARRWFARCAEPYAIVAGESWRAGNVCCYSPHRPVIYSSGDVGFLHFDSEHTTWTNDDDLALRGGVLLWGAYKEGDALPESARARFPNAEVQPPIVLPFESGAALRPDRIGVAFIWPGSGRRVSDAGKGGRTRY